MLTNTARPAKAPTNFPPDRFVRILNFANELSESRLREIKAAAANRWTPEKRAKKADLVHQHKPFRRATGPKTAAGKSRSALNAVKENSYGAGMKHLHKLLRAQRLMVKLMMLEHRIGHAPADMLEPRAMLLDEMMFKLRKALEAAGIENPALDARILARQGGGFSDAGLIAGGQTPLSNQQIESIEKFAARRMAGEPVSRILARREFWGLDFIVTPDTLDPRPDTETLVEAALTWARGLTAETGIAQSRTEHTIDKKPLCSSVSSAPSVVQKRKEGPLRILDLGTGTGCVLISLLKELPSATGVGIDLSHGAVAAARRNADALGVGGRAVFRCGSWYEPLEEGERFDLIVSNPPYIPRADIESLAVEVRKHDPILALSGGNDGLDAYKIILHGLQKHLGCGGRALFEIGQNQEKDLARLVDDSKMYLCDSHADLAGIVRVVELACGEK